MSSFHFAPGLFVKTLPGGNTMAAIVMKIIGNKITVKKRNDRNGGFSFDLAVQSKPTPRLFRAGPVKEAKKRPR